MIWRVFKIAWAIALVGFIFGTPVYGAWINTGDFVFTIKYALFIAIVPGFLWLKAMGK